jgi:hypothetical protein
MSVLLGDLEAEEIRAPTCKTGERCCYGVAEVFSRRDGRDTRCAHQMSCE